jgi:hypothetical protein
MRFGENLQQNNYAREEPDRQQTQKDQVRPSWNKPATNATAQAKCSHASFAIRTFHLFLSLAPTAPRNLNIAPVCSPAEVMRQQMTFRSIALRLKRWKSLADSAEVKYKISLLTWSGQPVVTLRKIFSPTVYESSRDLA